MRTTNASSSWAIMGRPGALRCVEPSNFWATNLRCQPRMVSGLTIVATSASACLPSFLPMSAKGLALAIAQAYTTFDLGTQHAIFGHQVLVAQQQFLIDSPRDIHEQVFPIHRRSPQLLPSLRMLSMGENRAEDKPKRRQW